MILASKTQTALLSWLALACSSFSATITFDDVDAGGLFALAPATNYQSLGVLFSREIPVLDIRASRVDASFRTNFIAAGGTLANAMALGTNFSPDLDLNLRFVLPGTTIPTTINYFRALFGDGDVGTLLGTLEAFDTNDVLIASVTSNTPPSEAAELVLSTPGIARVKIGTDADGSVIDNIFFRGPTNACDMPPLLSIYPAVEVMWPTCTNKLYQLQWCSEVDTNVWTSLGGPVVGTGSTNSVFDRSAGRDRRFYRVFILN